MHRHPWISAFFGVGSNLAMLVMIILVSWTRFLTGDSSTRSTRTEEAEDQAEDSDNMDAASCDQDAGTNVPVVCPARASRGIIWSIITHRVTLHHPIKLLLLITIGLVSFNAYQYETYEPGKLYEITLEQVTEFITSEKRFEDIDTLKTFIMNSYTFVITIFS